MHRESLTDRPSARAVSLATQRTSAPAPHAEHFVASQADDEALFDDYGRCHARGITDVAPDIRRRFVCAQPDIDYDAIHSRIGRYLGDTDALAAAEFARRAEAILERLASKPLTRNITRGVHVPFYLPRTESADIGQTLDERYLPAVQRSFQAMLAQYRFVNHHATGLAGKLSVAEGSRHEQLVGAARAGHLVGYYFPCLLEYSVPAAIAQVQRLPGEFLLAGGFDTCAAFIGSPDLLLRTDAYPPLLWLAGLAGEKAGVGYHFEAYGYNLTFNRRAHLGKTAEYWASALVVLG